MFRSIPKTATEWMVRISSGELSGRDRRNLEKWLAQKPENQRDLEKSRQLWSLSAQLRSSPTARSLLDRDEAVEGSRTRPGSRFAIQYLVPTAAIAVALVAAVLLRPQITQLLSAPRTVMQEAATARGQVGSYTLPDGSTLTLGAASSVRIAFNDKERVVYLSGGEGFFDVRHTPDRPFIVVAGQKRVVVTGTKFNVDFLPKENTIEVAVVEGLVNVTSPSVSAGSKTRPVKQNEVYQFSSDGSAVRRPISAAHASAWREGKLYFDNVRLSEVLANLNRYSAKPVMIGNADMGKLTVTGMFPAGDLHAVLVSLNALYGLKGVEHEDRWVLLPDANASPPI